MADYIPRQDGLALLWFQAFRDGILADWAQYALSQPDAETIRRVVDRFGESLRLANSPATGTTVSTDRKRADRVNAEGVCRHFAGRIKQNLGVSDEAKLAVGVPPLHHRRSRVECPQTSPALTIVASTPLAQTLRYADSVNMSSRAKPHGATCLQLFVVVGAQNASSPEGARFVGNFTSNPVLVTFDGSDRGRQATYFARWGGRRNQFGRWSLPVSMTIAA